MSAFTHVGFTGSRLGMSALQLKELRSWMADHAGRFVFHHGDCVGADAEAHALALVYAAEVVVHPPDRSTLRAFTNLDPADIPVTVRTQEPYLARNRAIVDETALLIAAVARGSRGTRHTVSYARRAGKPVILLGGIT